MHIGDQINHLRKKNGLSQDAFAEIFHISRQTVSNWENGKSYPDLEMIIQVSNYFEISVDELLKQDHNTVKKIDSQKKKSKIYFVMLVVVIVLSVTAAAGVYRHYRELNAVAFSMKNNETYQEDETNRRQLNVAKGYFSVQKAGKLDLKVNASTDDGKLHILIFDENKKVYYQLEGNDIKDSQKVYFEKGSYTIQIAADDYEQNHVVYIEYDIDVKN